MSEIHKLTSMVTLRQSLGAMGDPRKPNYNTIWETHGAVVYKRKFVDTFTQCMNVIDRQTDHRMVTLIPICEITFRRCRLIITTNGKHADTLLFTFLHTVRLTIYVCILLVVSKKYWLLWLANWSVVPRHPGALKQFLAPSSVLDLSNNATDHTLTFIPYQIQDVSVWAQYKQTTDNKSVMNGKYRLQLNHSWAIWL